MNTRPAKGLDIASEATRLKEQVDCLEKRAKEAMKKFGCVSPEMRAVYRAMADMLIAWHMFQDGLRS